MARLDPSTATLRFDDAHTDWVSELMYLSSLQSGSLLSASLDAKLKVKV